MSEMQVEVSVIIPVYNEEKHIRRCLESLKTQTYPIDKIEFIIIDGGSRDNTVSVIKEFENDLSIILLHNEKRIVTYALNMGIDNARGNYIVRMDAHAEYEKNYIEKCIYYLETADADNVGGIAITKGSGFVGSANADILSSKFGVGNSGFRTGAESGYVDTVPFGAFRKELFEKIGKFNINLPRSEDNDLNSRIRAAGGKVYLAADIKFTYFCRDTVSGILGQAIKNGNALFLTLRKNPEAMSFRHYIPFLFVLSLIALPLLSLINPLFLYLLGIEAAFYILLDSYFSFCFALDLKSLYKFLMFPVFHISYGIGSLLGLVGLKLY